MFLSTLNLHSLLVSIVITGVLYLLYLALFHSSDTLRLSYLYTAQNHVLTKGFPKRYNLPIWAKVTFLQIIYSMGSLLKNRIERNFEPYNETDAVPCAISDNDMILHWRIHRIGNRPDGEIEKKPVIIVFPGLTGNSEDAYLRTLIITVGKEYHVCVVNRIGSGVSTLRDPKLTFMSNWDSVHNVVNFVYEKMNGDAPLEEAEIPIFGVGYSLGGHNLLRYLTEKKYAPFKLKGAITLSQIFDIASNTYQMVKYHPYYTRILTGNLVRYVKRNEEAYLRFLETEEGKNSGFSLEKVYDCTTVPDFDEKVVKPLKGFTSILDEYYAPNSITIEALENVNIPVLILHSRDDPVCIKDGLPLDAPFRNDNIILGTTKYGGHCGFVQGGVLFPTLTSFSDELCYKFFENIRHFEKHYQYELDEVDE